MMEDPKGIYNKPIVIPLTNEQKGLATLERIEALLKTIADNTRRGPAPVFKKRGG